jgi:hypothetical protein
MLPMMRVWALQVTMDLRKIAEIWCAGTWHASPKLMKPPHVITARCRVVMVHPPVLSERWLSAKFSPFFGQSS